MVWRPSHSVALCFLERSPLLRANPIGTSKKAMKHGTFEECRSLSAGGGRHPDSNKSNSCSGMKRYPESVHRLPHGQPAPASVCCCWLVWPFSSGLKVQTWVNLQKKKDSTGSKERLGDNPSADSTKALMPLRVWGLSLLPQKCTVQTSSIGAYWWKVAKLHKLSLICSMWLNKHSATELTVFCGKEGSKDHTTAVWGAKKDISDYIGSEYFFRLRRIPQTLKAGKCFPVRVTFPSVSWRNAAR